MLTYKNTGGSNAFRNYHWFLDRYLLGHCNARFNEVVKTRGLTSNLSQT